MTDQPKRKPDCPENCNQECPNGLLNWPPSRGPKPYCMVSSPNSKIHYPEPEREDVEQPWKEPIACNLPDLHSAEEDAIESWKSFEDSIDPTRISSPRSFLCCTKEEKAAKDKALFEKKISYHLNAHVASVATLTPDQASKLLCALDSEEKSLVQQIEPARALEITLRYPLSLRSKLIIKPYTRTIREDRTQTNMTIGYVLWVIAKEYERIYEEHEKYGIWGHAIDDLYFEQLTIERNIGDLAIGS